MNATGADDGHAAETVGKEFAVGYYNALTAAAPGNEEPLERFCDHNSKYLFLRHGWGTEYQLRGAGEIARFAVRMKYHECAVDVLSVDAIKIARPGGISPWFAVLTVCKLSRRGTGVAHEFVQSTVIRYVPRALLSSENRFTIVGTVFKFADGTAADNGFEPDFETPPVEPDPGPLPSVPKLLSDHRGTAGDCPRPDGGGGGGGVDAFAIAVKSEGTPRKSKTRRGKHKAETRDGAHDALAATVICDGSETNGKNAVSADGTRVAGTVSVARPDRRRRLTPQTEWPEPAAAPVVVAGSGGPEETGTERAANDAEIAAAVNPRSAGGSRDDNAGVPVDVELYVGGLSRVIQRDEIYQSFCRFDVIADVRMYHSKRKKKGRYFSIVRFSDPAKMATVAELGTMVLNNGHAVMVRKSDPKIQAVGTNR
ncbi:RNA recognition motif domain [Cinara cedri]|uniref:RNA recognition motif domain n=1 Tax=Cinara cedri TaxID=506608 RepID=A0A5E4MIF3_9HEMI|nr:RNA recognition motif domain [Cinara cedri]